MRAIGRLTMPIFGYAIARGYYYTRNKNSYLWRMGILAVISQIPFMVLFASFEHFQIGSSEFLFPTLNMVIPWTLSLFFLRFRFLYVLPFIALLFYIPMDYTSVVILLPIAVYHLWFKSRKPVLALLTSAGVLSIIALMSDPVQWWSLLAIPLILIIEKHDGRIRLNKWVFYAYYPAHITALYGLYLLLGV